MAAEGRVGLRVELSVQGAGRKEQSRLCRYDGGLVSIDCHRFTEATNLWMCL